MLTTAHRHPERSLQPKMLIVAGPVASGKTGVFLAAREPLDSFDWNRHPTPNGGSRHGDSRYRPASREIEATFADRTLFFREHIVQRRSMVVEANLDTPLVLDFAEQGRRAGFTTQMIYLGTNDPEISVRRSRARQLGGGPVVDLEKVREVHRLSLENLPRAVRELDAVLAYDNSRHMADARLQFQTLRGRALLVSQTLEAWAREILDVVEPGCLHRQGCDPGPDGGSC
jgi:predicted ABC-type ATPase